MFTERVIHRLKDHLKSFGLEGSFGVMFLNTQVSRRHRFIPLLMCEVVRL